jgi:hypothetical protein
VVRYLSASFERLLLSFNTNKSILFVLGNRNLVFITDQKVTRDEEKLLFTTRTDMLDTTIGAYISTIYASTTNILCSRTSCKSYRVATVVDLVFVHVLALKWLDGHQLCLYTSLYVKSTTVYTGQVG